MKVAIFGLGYVGKFLFPSLQEDHETVAFSTNTQIGQSFIFDAQNSKDIEKLKHHKYDATITTFPIENEEFISMLFSICNYNILLGSTGIYDRRHFDEVITEDSELKKEHKRYAIEEYFVERGGIIVRLSGIYGPQRVPLNWLRSPRVGYSDKQLNLIHRDDIVAALKLMLCKRPTQKIYNLSDGARHSWKSIIDFAHEKNLLQEKIAPIEVKENSFVDNTRFCREYPQLQFHDLFEFLQR
ncbi:hypothetical protein [Candidatus Uabimicrobium amorphum]|uniref:NAD-dependent epimerase/dehydratase domain-containing protein n=1 Tax=Uabimicrobium amorphum TaxID=2596890 RepID=A0A5S9IIH9_UABAM|nr:hypothetical protein [Candidatus Uabimicrobium amorphum]BBM82423.1 hypothetical protein UABAM_00766 [Candidatus Uabimicrobium amorphum]